MKCSTLLAALMSLALITQGHAGQKSKTKAKSPTPAPASVPKPPASVLNRPLSKVEALNIAIAQNGEILQARSQVEAEYGVAIQTKAIVFPRVALTGGYKAGQDTLIENNLNNQAWTSDIQIVQSIYEGGRLRTAVSSSRLLRERAALVYQSTVADILLGVSTGYDDVLRDAKLVEVQQAAVNLYTEFLALTIIKQQGGVVTEYDVLRAGVELANSEALLVQAQGTYRTSKQRFVALLGYDLPTTISDNLSLKLTTGLAARPVRGDLAQALTDGLEYRAEIGALTREVALRDNSVTNARAGYKPSLQAFGGYHLSSQTQARNPGDPNYGALVGAQVSWQVFDGFLTKGQVDEAVALRKKAIEARDETTRRVELQVRASWSDLRTAKAVLDAQAKNVDRAEQALKLAQIRYNEGAGTQIDVLNSQTSLTQARGSYVAALRDYSVAYAGLLRATGRDLKAR
jgi:outer membrane protein TolC